MRRFPKLSPIGLREPKSRPKRERHLLWPFGQPLGQRSAGRYVVLSLAFLPASTPRQSGEEPQRVQPCVRSTIRLQIDTHRSRGPIPKHRLVNLFGCFVGGHRPAREVFCRPTRQLFPKLIIAFKVPEMGCGRIGPAENPSEPNCRFAVPAKKPEGGAPRMRA